MKLLDLRLLLTHAPEMGSVHVLHPDNAHLDIDLWMLVRWAHTMQWAQTEGLV